MWIGAGGQCSAQDASCGCGFFHPSLFSRESPMASQPCLFLTLHSILLQECAVIYSTPFLLMASQIASSFFAIIKIIVMKKKSPYLHACPCVHVPTG